VIRGALRTERVGWYRDLIANPRTGAAPASHRAPAVAHRAWSDRPPDARGEARPVKWIPHMPVYPAF
jgi:hypothetical protein